MPASSELEIGAQRKRLAQARKEARDDRTNAMSLRRTLLASDRIGTDIPDSGRSTIA